MTLFQGLREGIGQLHGRRLPAGGGHRQEPPRPRPRPSGLRACSRSFMLSRCADEGFPKPHPEMLIYLMDMLGVAPQRTLMIGDTSHDLEMARAARRAWAGVTYGAHRGDSLRALAPAGLHRLFAGAHRVAAAPTPDLRKRASSRSAARACASASSATGRREPAFAVRFDGVVHAYLNRCAHVPVELDWVEGEFFDLSRLYLVCSTHGAAYLPESGRCVAGPCSGSGLVALRGRRRPTATFF